MNSDTADPPRTGIDRRAAGEPLARTGAGGETVEAGSAPTGVGGSELERRAAATLARELEGTGRAVQVQEIRVRAGAAPTVALHAILAVAGSLVGLLSPIAGAAITLIAAFSFYGERGLGLFLLSRLLPRRRSRNVISPPLGPVWESEVDTILVAGFDAPSTYPVGAWLARRFDGFLTTDRLLFWAGMIPVFATLMLRLVHAEGLPVELLQIIATAVLLAVLAAQVDRRLQGETLGVEADLAAARDLISAVGELESDGEESEGDAGIAVCLFGAESDGAAGAEAFYSDRRLRVRPGVTVLGLVSGAPDAKPEATAREGDLTGVKMNLDLVEKSPLRPQPVIIRRDTAAGRARRRGTRATTLVGHGEEGLDLLFDAIEAAAPVTASEGETR